MAFRAGMELLSIALLAGAPFALTTPLAAQAREPAFLGLSLGVGIKPPYGQSDTRGPMVRVEWGRFVLPRAAVRLDAELQLYEAPRQRQWVDAPCPPTGTCDVRPVTIQGAGAIRLASALVSAEWYEQRDRRGFYLVAGAGTQLLLAHPDRALAARVATQLGAGISLGTVLFEARYQATLGARAAPRHVVALGLGVRATLDAARGR